MGADINVHDQWACESMGAIQDRTREHLGQSDKAISAYRRLLRGAIAAAGNGGRPPMVLDAAAAARHDRPGRDRRHRPDRRLAGLLAKHRRERGAGRRAGPAASDNLRPVMPAKAGVQSRERCYLGLGGYRVLRLRGR